MIDDMPDRPAPLTEAERDALIEGALESNTGHAIQGVYLQSLVLKRWFADVDPAELLEASDSGLAASQKVLDEMPLEERSELLNRAIELFRIGCMEAILQLERLTL